LRPTPQRTTATAPPVRPDAPAMRFAPRSG
jgi:hypothetical protein